MKEINLLIAKSQYKVSPLYLFSLYPQSKNTDFYSFFPQCLILYLLSLIILHI